MNPARILTLTAISGIPSIRPGDNLPAVILHALKENNLTLKEGDILVLAQKIVSKAEGRFVDLRSVQPSPRAQDLASVTEKDPRLVELVLRESNEVLRARKGLLVVEHRLGFVCANAGIDRSNVAELHAAGEWVLLLPVEPDASCRAIHDELFKATGVSVGVVINDSHGRAWRIGTVGSAIGVYGVPVIEDMRGKKDLFAYPLQITQVSVVDELSSAASLVMGQADEGLPVVLTRGFPYSLRQSGMREVYRPKEEDAFR